jgi:hypothetical protein
VTPILAASSIPSQSTRDRAARSLLTHAFAPGQGYIDYGYPPPVPVRSGTGGNECLPAKGAPDGSYHMLRAPKSEPMVFVWVAGERAWGRMGGHRLAFTPEYLGLNGWSYVRPATEADMRTDLQRGQAIQFRRSVMQNA